MSLKRADQQGTVGGLYGREEKEEEEESCVAIPKEDVIRVVKGRLNKKHKCPFPDRRQTMTCDSYRARSLHCPPWSYLPKMG